MIDVHRYLRDLLLYVTDVEAFTADGRDFFMQDRKTQASVIRSYEVIGEIVKRLPNEILDKQPQIDWRRVKGFRDFLIHNYGSIDLDAVWDAVEQQPQLKQAVVMLIQQHPKESSL